MRPLPRPRYLDSFVLCTTYVTFPYAKSVKHVLEMSPCRPKSRLTATKRPASTLVKRSNRPCSLVARCLAPKQGQLIGHFSPSLACHQRPRVKNLSIDRSDILADRHHQRLHHLKWATTTWELDPTGCHSHHHHLCCTAVDSSDRLVQPCSSARFPTRTRRRKQPANHILLQVVLLVASACSWDSCMGSG